MPGKQKHTNMLPFALCANLICDKYPFRFIWVSTLPIIIGSANGNVDMKLAYIESKH